MADHESAKIIAKRARNVRAKLSPSERDILVEAYLELVSNAEAPELSAGARVKELSQDLRRLVMKVGELERGISGRTGLTPQEEVFRHGALFSVRQLSSCIDSLKVAKLMKEDA